MNETRLPLPPHVAAAFAELALKNVVREYPNHTSHVTTGPDDTARPRELHPIFFGCFDWHSCVHGYWLLTRLRRTVPDLPCIARIDRQLDSAFTVENVAAEMRYFSRPECRGFERPYGWAWLLMLCHELLLHEHDRGRRWHFNLLPLADLIANRFIQYLPKADYPVRAGAHSNGSFAMTLAMEYAVSHGNTVLSSMMQAKARQWYLRDTNCQVWEPSQSDFLSPALMESLCMLRLLPMDEFQNWFAKFLPELGEGKPAVLFEPARVSDRTDGQIAHLDGLNLSRAWCFGSIAAALPTGHSLGTLLNSAAKTHLDASLANVFGDYAGEHWLATFALLALSV